MCLPPQACLGPQGPHLGTMGTSSGLRIWCMYHTLLDKLPEVPEGWLIIFWLRGRSCTFAS